ncbi:MAG: four helix bundle protein [Deltaproteobacteria bacterium]|nr:four helix bundle protein [Deltaproteobacteria bacterium]
MLKNYRELKVWQKSYKLCLDLYRITKKFKGSQG